MGPKMAGAFATIFMDKMQILDKGARLETLHGRHNLSRTKTDMSSISSSKKQINPTNNQINNQNICFRGYFL